MTGQTNFLFVLIFCFKLFIFSISSLFVNKKHELDILFGKLEEKTNFHCGGGVMETIVPIWKRLVTNTFNPTNFDHQTANSRRIYPRREVACGFPDSGISLEPWPTSLEEIRILFMSHPTPKKRRLSPSQGHIVNLQEQLKKLSTEKEPYLRPTTAMSKPAVQYIPSYRAVLAKRGFLVRENLGSGSYSKVKMAIDVNGKYGERVAVKIIDKQKAPRDYQEKFLPRELRIWPNLNHPNLIRLCEVFQDSRRVYMVVEYAECGDVLRYIQDKGAISERQACKWLLQISDAVRYMHNLDITHRDLKLENLLLDSDLNIKICDFGFIKPDSSFNLSKTYCGSKSYAAPEILLGHPYEPSKSDVWAMGVILYIMVTGKMPFDETKGTKSILEEHRRLTFRWPKSKKISNECQNVIMNMFQWDYRSRPSIHVVLNDPWFHQKRSPEKASKPTQPTDCPSPGNNSTQRQTAHQAKPATINSYPLMAKEQKRLAQSSHR